ncbi:MAG: 4Fe-4S dicluster domain-containing protein, partial [Slackia sp.]
MAGKAAPGERGFRAQAAIAAVAASAAAAMAAAPSRADAAIRPPGARDEGDFAARCIRCGRCMEACPYQAIHADAGLNAATAGMPLLDVRAQACRLCEDLPCIAACPTEALHALTSREEVRMGVAVIRRDVC